MIANNTHLKCDTIKLVSHTNHLISINEALFKHDIDPSTGEIKSVEFKSQNHKAIAPFELYIHANYQTGKTMIEFSSKLLLNDYPKLISAETLPQCLHNIEKLGVCCLNIDSLINDSSLTKLHVTKDIDLELTPDILNRLNLCTGDYRRYNWDVYNDGISFRKNVKSTGYRESLTIYNKEKEILLLPNRGFLNSLSNAEGIKNYFCGKTRIEVQLTGIKNIKRALAISDTSVKAVMNTDTNVLLSRFDKIFIGGTQIHKAFPDSLPVHTPSDYGLWSAIRLHQGDLKKIEQEIKDLKIYGENSRAAMWKLMKRVKEIAQAWNNQEMNADNTIEQIRNLLIN